MRKIKKLSVKFQTLRSLTIRELDNANAGRMPDGTDRDHTCDDCGPTTPMVCIL